MLAGEIITFPLRKYIFRGIFRIQSNTYDGPFLRKLLTAFTDFLKKFSIVDVRLSCKYTSEKAETYIFCGRDENLRH